MDIVTWILKEMKKLSILWLAGYHSLEGNRAPDSRSVVELLSNMCEALGLVPSTGERRSFLSHGNDRAVSPEHCAVVTMFQIMRTGQLY